MMLDEEFLATLDRRFPEAYPAARGHLQRDVEFVLKVARSDEGLARHAAKAYAGLLLWWPYVRSGVPVGDHLAPAAEAVVRIVLLVDKLHSYEPSEAELREQVQRVVKAAFDPLEIRAIFQRATSDGGSLAWAAPVLVPLVGPALGPQSFLALARRIPLPYLGLAAAVVAAAVATIPIATGWSLAARAAKEAREPRMVAGAVEDGGTQA